MKRKKRHFSCILVFLLLSLSTTTAFSKSDTVYISSGNSATTQELSPEDMAHIQKMTTTPPLQVGESEPVTTFPDGTILYVTVTDEHTTSTSFCAPLAVFLFLQSIA